MFPLSFIFLVFFLFSVLVSYERKNHNILGPLDPEKNPTSFKQACLGERLGNWGHPTPCRWHSIPQSPASADVRLELLVVPMFPMC